MEYRYQVVVGEKKEMVFICNSVSELSRLICAMDEHGVPVAIFTKEVAYEEV